MCCLFRVTRGSPAQDCAQITMEGGVDLAALGTRAENDAFDQATKSLGGLGPVFRTVQSLGEVGDLLGVELRGARENVRGVRRGFGEQGRKLGFASLQRVHRRDHRLLEQPSLIASTIPWICFSTFVSSARQASPRARRSRFSRFISSA